VSRSAQLGIAVLEGSGVDEPLEEQDDLCADEMPAALILVELGELVLEDFVEIAAVTTIWNYQAHLRHVADDEVEKSGEEQFARQRRIC
jgi:hypothetical protein